MHALSAQQLDRRLGVTATAGPANTHARHGPQQSRRSPARVLAACARHWQAPT